MRRLSILCVLFIFAVPVFAQRVPPAEYNMLYGTDEQGRRRLDVYLPEDAGGELVPALLMFHGSPGDKGSMVNDGMVELLIQHGIAAIPVNYTTDLPIAYGDALCALGWTLANAETYGIDPARIGAFGVSYGGLVTAMLAALDDRSLFEADCPHTIPDDFELAAAVTNAGLLLPSIESIMQFLGLDNLTDEQQALVRELSTAETSAALREADLPEDVRIQLQIYPVYWIDGSEPPHFLIHGVGDSAIPYSETYLYGEMLSASRVSATLLIDRAAGHVPAPRAFDDELIAFLTRVFER